MIPNEINAFIAKERMNFMPVNDGQMSRTVAVFSKNLTRLVKNKMNGLPFSQSQFAKENNLGTTALNQWCNGRRFPSDENLDRLCQIFPVPLAELFIEPWQSINIDKKIAKSIKPIKPKPLSPVTTLMFHNDSLLYTSPSSLNNGCTALCIFDRQFAICSVKAEGNKFVFTNLNSPSQSWQFESSAAYSAVLGIVLKLSRNF